MEHTKTRKVGHHLVAKPYDAILIGNTRSDWHDAIASPYLKNPWGNFKEDVSKLLFVRKGEMMPWFADISFVKSY
jgi:hypothetical protein